MPYVVFIAAPDIEVMKTNQNNSLKEGLIHKKRPVSVYKHCCSIGTKMFVSNMFCIEYEQRQNCKK